MNISEFLEARIAEDEAAAREVETDFEFDPSNPLRSALDVYAPGYDTYPVISMDSTRVLAECAAKRVLVEDWKRVTVEHRRAYLVDPPLAPVVAAFAAVYKDHPDYQQEWLSK